MTTPDQGAGGASDHDARFRHDLLTPVNHILGFCSLLIDAAEDLGRPERLSRLRGLREDGGRVLEMIELALPRHPTPDHVPDYPLLADRLTIPLGAIVLACDDLGSAPSDDSPDREEFLDDLAKIRRASHLLVEMARQGPARLPATLP